MGYLKEARLDYGDEGSYMIRIPMPDHTPDRRLDQGACVRLYSRREADAFLEGFERHRFVQELVVSQRLAG